MSIPERGAAIEVPRHRPIENNEAEDRQTSYSVPLGDGRQVPWQGFFTGPKVLKSDQVAEICETLLGIPIDQLTPVVEQTLVPAVGDQASYPAFFLHSTTPELKTFDGDLDAVKNGKTPGDFTTYKETRSVYLSRPGDIAIGRTATWRAAVEAIGADAIQLPDVEHYYLSHALLNLAMQHRTTPVPAMDRLVSELRRGPRIIRLYAFEQEMQIFLLWLARQAGLAVLPVEANAPQVAATWNCKSVLHPTVDAALALGGTDVLSVSPEEWLRIESQQSFLIRELGIDMPALPGYTIERSGKSRDAFVEQLLCAADLLRTRYGLTQGCLKASESGDGARITPGLNLADRSTLEALGKDASGYGDDYVLEAHLNYGRPRVAGQELITALSAHIRGGQVAPGATMQFMEGTSWKGNVFLDRSMLAPFAVSDAHYARMRHFMQEFVGAFDRRGGGLVLAGVDFGIGTVGGRFETRPLLGVQDLNISFTGAECLRAFLERSQREDSSDQSAYGVVRIVKPKREGGDHAAFHRVTERWKSKGIPADTVASVPGRWAMVGVGAPSPVEAMERLSDLLQSLNEEGLVASN